jgi:hypothetical protein
MPPPRESVSTRLQVETVRSSSRTPIYAEELPTLVMKVSFLIGEK